MQCHSTLLGSVNGGGDLGGYAVIGREYYGKILCTVKIQSLQAIRMGIGIDVVGSFEQAASAMIPGILVLLIKHMVCKVGINGIAFSCIRRLCSYGGCVLALLGQEIAGFIGIEVDNAGVTVPGEQTVTPEEPGILLLAVIEGNLYHIVILGSCKENLVL